VAVAERKTKEERRDEILEAAVAEFAANGYRGASTEAIARSAGISQPYVFRLFGTKQELFRVVVARCFRETLELFQRAAEGLRGPEALHAIGNAYVERLATDPMRLQLQLQAYTAAVEDEAIRETVRVGYGDLVAFVDRVAGVDAATLSKFFAQGMLLNVFAAMQLGFDTTEPWAARLLAGCKENG